MKVLFVNAVPNRGGAAKAARRIAESVRLLGHNVHFASIFSSDVALEYLDTPPSALSAIGLGYRRVMERLPALVAHRSVKSPEFSSGLRQFDLSHLIDQAGADVVNLHWVNYGQLSPEGIAQIRSPVVWTLHDMWAFTGGCHHSTDCERYTTNCGFCPVLNSREPNDLSRQLWQRKRTAWRNQSFRVVTPSTWLANRAGQSSLLGAMPRSVIPNPLDLSKFRPGDKELARRRLGLPSHAQIILFAAQQPLSNRAKGFHLLWQAMQLLRARGSKAELLVLGHGLEKEKASAPFPIHYLGYRTSDDDIVSAYQSADVFTLPSLYENLPNTIAEALACGTPSVAFNVGGIPDLILPGTTGFLAPPYDIPELSKCIEACLAAPGRSLEQNARKHAESMLSMASVGRAYCEEFSRALEGAAWSAEASSEFQRGGNGVAP